MKQVFHFLSADSFAATAMVRRYSGVICDFSVGRHVRTVIVYDDIVAQWGRLLFGVPAQLPAF
jgi:hypothetical protein